MALATSCTKIEASVPIMWAPKISPVSGFAKTLANPETVLYGRTVGGVVIVVAGNGVLNAQCLGFPLGHSDTAHLRRGEDGVGHGMVIYGHFIVRIEYVVGRVSCLQVSAVL